VGLSGTVSVLLALSLLAGVGAGLLNPAQQAAVADVIGSERTAGKVLAVFQMIQDVGAILGPVVAGLLADAVGFPAAFLATGALVMAASLPWFRTAETLDRVRLSG